MQSIPDYVRPDLIKLLPSSVVNEISCFVFYDNHPRDKRKIDIIICTKVGEVKEYFKREPVSCLNIKNESVPSRINLFRNSKCELYYLISAGDELCIILRKDVLFLKQKISNIDSYEINDLGCIGTPCLKVLKRDDAVPLIFDDNLESMGEHALFIDQLKSHDTIPLIKDLRRKYVEAQFAVKANEKAYKELLALRQATAYSNYEQRNPNSMDTLLNAKCQSSGGLKIKTSKPWVKVCNKKVVVAVEVFNTETEPLRDIHILFQRTIKSAVAYKSSLFKKTETAPYWEELESQNIKPNEDLVVVCTINLKELKHSIISKVEFCCVICYTCKNKEFLLPFENIIISASEVMGEEFDVLYKINKQKENYTFLALLATTLKLDVHIRILKSNKEPDLDIKSILKCNLKMENIINSENIFVHCMSPFHILYGIMAIIEENKENKLHYNASLHARAESQILAFIHYIHDSVPCRVIITPVNYRITSKTDEYSQYNEDITPFTLKQNIEKYGKAVLNQSVKTLDYLDQCMIKMNENQDAGMQSKLGSEIDVFAGGVESFTNFRGNMLEEAAKGTESLSTIESDSAKDEGMVIEIDD